MRSASSKAVMFQELQSLDGALASVRTAILAAHPELLEPDAASGQMAHVGPVRLSATGWIGDEILSHIAGLTTSLIRYSQAMQAERVFPDQRSRPAPERAPRGHGRERAA